MDAEDGPLGAPKAQPNRRERMVPESSVGRPDRPVPWLVQRVPGKTADGRDADGAAHATKSTFRRPRPRIRSSLLRPSHRTGPTSSRLSVGRHDLEGLAPAVGPGAGGIATFVARGAPIAQTPAQTPARTPGQRRTRLVVKLDAMIPVLGGLGAALLFTVSVLASARASRLIGAPSSVAWAMTIGLVVTLPVAFVTAPSPDFGRGAWAWFLAAGLGNVIGLLLTYAAYRVGAVAVIVTIASTEGAIAAVLAVLAGEAL